MTADVDLRDVSSYALRLANRNLDPQVIVRALLRDDAIVQIQVTRGAAKARATAERKAAWAVAKVKAEPKEEWRSRIPARIVGYREAADSRPWHGRTAPTDRRVLEAFYMTGTFARSTKFRFAARTIGGRTGLPWRTASESTRRLCGSGLLRIAGNYGPGLGTKYVLAAPRSWDTSNLHNRSSPPAPIVPGLGRRSPSDPLVQHVLAHEAFRNRAGLGDAGWLLMHWLDDLDPAKPRVLSDATGLDYDRVRYVLGLLHSSGIARPVPNGWIRVPDVELLPTLDEYAQRHIEALNRWSRAAAASHLLLVQERGIRPGHAVSWWEIWWGSLSEARGAQAA